MASSSSSVVKDEKPRVATGLNKDGTLTLEMAKKGQRYPEESPGSGDYVFYQTLYEENPILDEVSYRFPYFLRNSFLTG